MIFPALLMPPAAFFVLSKMAHAANADAVIACRDHAAAAVGDAAGECCDACEEDAAIMPRDRAGVGDPPAGTGIAEDGDDGTGDENADSGSRKYLAVVADAAGKAGNVCQANAGELGLDGVVVGDAAAGAGIAEDSDVFQENALAGRELAAVADDAGEAGRTTGDFDCRHARGNDAAVGDAAARAAGAKDGHVRDDNAVLRLRGDRAAVGDAAEKGRVAVNDDAIGARGNLAGIDDAAAGGRIAEDGDAADGDAVAAYEIVPLLLTPPEKVEPPETSMPAAPAEMALVLLMPPAKVATSATKMPEASAAAIWPVFLMPLANEVTPPTKTPTKPAEIVPLLPMPPAKVDI